MTEPIQDTHPAFEAMCLHLEREAAVYAQLMELGRRQKAALVARDTETLMRLITAQTPLAAEAVGLQRSGQDALEALSAALGLPVQTTISDLLPRLPAEQEIVLRGLCENIARFAEEFAWIQRTNRLLLEGAMDAVRFTMQLLAAASREPEAGYVATEAPLRSASLMLDQTA